MFVQQIEFDEDNASIGDDEFLQVWSGWATDDWKDAKFLIWSFDKANGDITATNNYYENAALYGAWPNPVVDKADDK